MPALGLVTVKEYDGSDVNKQRLISFDHVVTYSSELSGVDTRVIYNPFGESHPLQVVLDDSYSSFNTSFQDKVNSVGVPMFFETINGIEFNEQKVVKSDQILWAQDNTDGSTAVILFFDQDYTLKEGRVRHTIASIYAAQYNPAAAVAENLYRDGQETSGGAGTVNVTFSSDLGTTDYDLYFTDLDSVGIDSATIVKTTSGFSFTALAGGDFTYLAIIRE